MLIHQIPEFLIELSPFDQLQPYHVLQPSLPALLFPFSLQTITLLINVDNIMSNNKVGMV
ncbi:MAG: hypothetical protein MJE68_30290 [Proteobacteria bacterium]|nr:hypothetical protein [Pseudomonadota bacterium]